MHKRNASYSSSPRCCPGCWSPAIEPAHRLTPAWGCSTGLPACCCTCSHPALLQSQTFRSAQKINLRIHKFPQHHHLCRQPAAPRQTEPCQVHPAPRMHLAMCMHLTKACFSWVWRGSDARRCSQRAVCCHARQCLQQSICCQAGEQGTPGVHLCTLGVLRAVDDVCRTAGMSKCAHTLLCTHKPGTRGPH